MNGPKPEKIDISENIDVDSTVHSIIESILGLNEKIKALEARVLALEER